MSTEISLAGRYMVLMPFSDRVSISQKIDSAEEKSRLKKLIRSIKPHGFGVIVRTVAQGKKVAELDKDLKNLYKKSFTTNNCYCYFLFFRTIFIK